nr:hypothetical protein [Tanacetum cinerariifolium]
FSSAGCVCASGQVLRRRHTRRAAAPSFSGLVLEKMQTGPGCWRGLVCGARPLAAAAPLFFFQIAGFMLRTSSILVLASTLSFAAAGQSAPPVATVRSRAAGPVSGRLTDAKTGEALPGVNVIFPDLKQGTATDAEG